MKEYVSLGFLEEEIYWNSDDFGFLIGRCLARFSQVAVRSHKAALGKDAITAEGLKNIHNALFN
jgi:hypothetical protein